MPYCLLDAWYPDIVVMVSACVYTYMWCLLDYCLSHAAATLSRVGSVSELIMCANPSVRAKLPQYCTNASQQLGNS